MSDDEKSGETVSGDMVRYTPAPVAEYRPQIMLAPEEAKALDDALRANMLAVLRPDVDYGVIPGTKKPSLLKPGAEKLLQWFGYGHTMVRDEIERDADGQRVGVTYKCTVTKALADGRMAVVAACDGYAGYDEDRFYVSAADAEAKERANAAKYRRDPWPAKFAEYRAPWNSVIKMAEKRAMVGAAIVATAASGLFTQDMEDIVPAAPVTPIGDAGIAAIKGLTPGVQSILGSWYRKQRWPEPREWSPEQWCAALIEAGRIAAEAPAPAASREPAAEPQGNGDQDRTQGWIDWARQHAAEFTTEEAGRDLKAKVTETRRDGKINGATAQELHELIDARIGDIAKPAVEGVVTPPLDPEDAWAAKVEDITSAAEAAMAEADLDVLVKGRKIGGERAAQIRAAIQAKGASFEAAA